MQTFLCAPSLIVRAPGRVNIIGEHTDYNGGFVMPCAIDFHTYVAIRPREDNKVRVSSIGFGMQINEFELSNLRPNRDDGNGWLNYIYGTIAGIMRNYEIPIGFEIAINSDLPQGAGLSSSASLEIAIGFAISNLFKLSIPLEEIAKIGQFAEHNFAGCNCGLMDQYASALGKKDHALFLDCETLNYELIEIPNDWSIFIIHSGVKRGLVDGEYNARRAQCEKAAQFFKLKFLRHLSKSQILSKDPNLDELSFLRARHNYSENQRVLSTITAFKDKDLSAIHEIMAQSHLSMAHDFEITCPKIDELANLANQILGKNGGARMTGGGFGGAVIAIVNGDSSQDFIAEINRKYRTPDDSIAFHHHIKPSNGVEII